MVDIIWTSIPNHGWFLVTISIIDFITLLTTHYRGAKLLPSKYVFYTQISCSTHFHVNIEWNKHYVDGLCWFVNVIALVFELT
jgi:hypothetical protein